MLNIYSKYAPNANVANTNYPHGSGKDESASGTNDGTPLEMDWYNDMLGYSEALLAEAGVEPSGSADTALNSDRMDAFRIAAMRVETAVAYGVGDVSLVGVIALVTGDDVTDYTHIVDGDSLTRWSVGSVTGTFAGDFNSSTGIDSGLSGALTKIAAFGTAAYADLIENSLDQSADRVLTTGAGGLLGTCSLETIDFHDNPYIGSTKLPQVLTTPTSSNLPSSGNYYYPQFIQYGSADTGTMIAWPYDLSSNDTLYMNTKVGGIWSGWKKFYHNGNLFGDLDSAGYGIGVNQTDQDVTLSRSVGTTYTNTTSKPIEVNITLSIGAPSTDIRFTRGGVQVYRRSAATWVGDSVITVSMLVKAGQTYILSVPTGSVTIDSWLEMKQ